MTPKASVSSARRTPRRWRLVLVFALVAFAFAATPAAFLAQLFGRDLSRAGAYLQTYLLLARGAAALAGFAGLALYFLRDALAADFAAYRERLGCIRSGGKGSRSARLPMEREGWTAVAIVGGLLAFVALAYVSAPSGGWVNRVAQENGPLETATVLMYLAAAGCGVALILRESRSRVRTGLRAWLLVPLTAFCLLIAGEETNWGQTYFRYETPALLSETNAQEEVSLHNIRLPAVDAEGRPYKRSYWADTVLRCIAGSIGLGLPLAMWIFPAFGRWVWALGVPLPSRATRVGFTVVALLPGDQRIRGWFAQENMPSELREVLCAGCFLLLLWHPLRTNPAAANTPAGVRATLPSTARRIGAVGAK